MNVIAEVPACYDERSRIFAMFDGALCVAHPEHPPLIVEHDGSIHEVTPCIRTTTCVVNIFD